MMEHDHLCDRMSWQQPFDHGTGAARRGRGLAIALKAAISHDIGRGPQRRRRRQRHSATRFRDDETLLDRQGA
jgi:hypothetical protein